MIIVTQTLANPTLVQTAVLDVNRKSITTPPNKIPNFEPTESKTSTDREKVTKDHGMKVSQKKLEIEGISVYAAKLKISWKKESSTANYKYS